MHFLSRALNRPAADIRSAKEFLDVISIEYESLLDVHEPTDAKSAILKLLRSSEPEESTELCWNWKSPQLHILRTIKNRGKSYNGRPLSLGYFGAYSMDGLAMALHAFYTTTSFNEAVVKVINFLGDSDTTGSICAQIAGAFYGIDAIDPVWIRDLNTWDDREIELRAILLATSTSSHSR